MKLTTTLSLILALSTSTVAFAQTGDMKGMEMKDMNKMQHMEMKNTEMKDMDMQQCMDMMDMNGMHMKDMKGMGMMGMPDTDASKLYRGR